MPARQDSYTVSIPTSPPPPQDLSSYSRFIHDHTKRLMEASGTTPPRSSSSRHSKSSTMTNGSTSPSDYHV